MSSFIVRNTSFASRGLLLDLARGFEAVQERHRDVQDDDVGLELLGGVDEGPPVGDLADDVVVSREQFLEGAEEERVIVGEQNSRSTHAQALYPVR